MTDDGYTYTLAVITKIPDPDKGESGNLYHMPPVYYEKEAGGWNDELSEYKESVSGNFWDDFWKPMIDAGIVTFDSLPMGPLFELGQILYLNEHGRCIVSGTKPSKWYVETQEVLTLQDAIALSRKVQGYDD